ncbi:CGNR zinc finger domain-containing protein [Prauserella oleivorans]|uniref:CGNR zinc finger domain-containing protein n=1 Tax=Prauserella oleivorans TaxID=1478153 RepID=A0ABW5WDG3_9PSEU
MRDHLARADLAATSAELTAVAARTGAGIRWSETGSPEFAEKDHTTADGFVISVLQILFFAEIKGEPERVKVCRSSQCRFVFYDRSPARNSTWCSMDICGARHKMRAYRSRRAR